MVKSTSKEIVEVLLRFYCLFILCRSQEQIATNYFEPMNRFSLSTEQLLEIQNEIYHKIQLNEDKLRLIKDKSSSLIEKWQELLQVILPIQMDVIMAHNLGDGQCALSKFNEEYTRNSSESIALSELNKEKWLFIFNKAFGVSEFKKISLQEAQNLITEITEEMTSEPFLIQIDCVINSFKPKASLIEKRQAVLAILFPLHMSIMERHGFNGELGYIQAQRAIMDYYHDPKIGQSASNAQSVVFRRAQLIQK